MQPQRYSLLDAPSTLGLKPGGVARLPDALRAAGLRRRLAAQDAGRVPVPPYNAARDPSTLLLNGPALRAYAFSLATALTPLFRAGRVPVVLGGDCSVLLGCLLALRPFGPVGLAFLDGHSDFYAPNESASGEVADMELGLITGRGPALLSELDGLGPLVRDEHVAAIGVRDHHEVAAAGARDIRNSPITCLDLAVIRATGLAATVERALHVLRRPASGRFWVHLDADVLHDAHFPAVDYRLPDGLAPAEVSELLQGLAGSGGMLGISVTIFNPDLDRDGSLAALLVETLANGLRPGSATS